jgi:hypothetical protein
VKSSAVSSSSSSSSPSSSSSSSSKPLIPQNLTFAQPGILSLFINDQLNNPAVGKGTGTITYSSDNTTVATVDNNGKVMIKAAGSAIISASIAADSTYLLATTNYSIKAAPSDILMTAWIGKTNTLVNFPAEANGLWLYRSSQLNCNIDNYPSCAFGQFNILNGTTITDTASTNDRTGYYVLKHGNKKAELSISKLFSARLNHQLVYFKNQLWLIAGNDRNNNYFNDIWSSTDGTAWTQQTTHAAFSARTGHRVFVFNNKLWLIGGYDNQTKNDIWSSSDGINWTLESANAAFSARKNHTITSNGTTLFLIGGNTTNVQKNDVWSSIDAIHWTQETAVANFSPRETHQSIYFKNKLWVIGGFTDN